MAISMFPITGSVAANGNLTVRVRPTNRQTWIVSQVSVEMAGAPLAAACAVRYNGSLVSPLVPQADAASGDPPVKLGPNDVLTVEWTGCTPGIVGRVLLIYDDGN